MAKTKVLIIEDDRALSEVLRYNLIQAGFDVSSALDGQDGVNQARLKTPDLVLVDIMIPILDGIEVCKRLRAAPETRDCWIVMLTAKGEESDQIVGFSVGADDYVVKPFSVKVLLERLKALKRRNRRQESTDLLVAGDVRLDRLKHRVSVDGQPVDLTPSEFRLLETLIRQPGRAFDRSELIDAALGDDTLVMERTIDVHIRSLRKKLGPAARLIQTVRGVGYRLLEDQLV